MRLTRGLDVLVLVAVTTFAAARYDLWHTIDDAMVVCPPLPVPAAFPQGMTLQNWPTTQEFRFQIGFDSGMNPNKPHVVTFFHSGTKPVSVTFQIDDKNGDSVVPETTVNLSPVAAATAPAQAQECTCSGVNTGLNVTHYGQDYGKRCAAWDSQNCAGLHATLTPGPWCCQQWCYVTGNCPDSFPSTLVDGLRWSYVGACGDTNTTACSYQPPDPCAPVNVDQLPQWSAANITTFGQGYGSSCKSWDYTWCSEKYPPDVVDSWCCGAWKWVSAQCPSAIASNLWPGLYWSDAACPDREQFVATCPFKKSAGINGGSASFVSSADTDPACACQGYSPPGLHSGRRRQATKSLPLDYGSYCAAWDATHCSDYYPRLDHEIWCCRSWCYVDEDCKSANPSSTVPGAYWSYESCPDDGMVLTNCSFSDACKPTGNNTLLGAANLAKYGQDYGKTCGAWDKDNCELWYNSSIWWATDSKNWCCQSWALVNESCPIAEPSTNAPGLIFWAYNICPDTPSNPIYNLATKQCTENTTRRLEEVPTMSDTTRAVAGLGEGNDIGKLKLKLVEEAEDAAERRLSARRRSFGRTSSSRRRASTRRRTPTRVSDTSRRRFDYRRRATATSDFARRRVPVVSTPPRRRAPMPSAARRRIPVAVPSSAWGRRRAPVGTPTVAPTERRRSVAVASNLARRRAAPTFPPNMNMDSLRRRRTMDVSGRRWNTEATRRRITAPSNSPRRRSINYGWPDRNNLQHYYGYSVPMQTAYGYSGHGPQRNSVAYLAMAGAGGVALGAGGYYLYKQMYDRNWASQVPFNDRSWCMVPDGTYQGRMIRCSDCGQLWSAARCKHYNDCWSGGCEFNLPSDTRRDDLMNTGFIPGHYLPNLTVTITAIVGDDYRAADICPATQPTGQYDDAWLRASTVRLSLYATITEMENMNLPNTGAASFSSGAPTPAWPLVFSLMALVIYRILPAPMSRRPVR